MKVDVRKIKMSLLLSGIWLLTLGGGILIGKHCLLPTEIASESSTGGSLNQTNNAAPVVEVPEVLIMGDMQNLPYQKKIWNILLKFNAGDLYGEEREKSISLVDEYWAKCDEAKVEPFGFLKIEEREKFHAVFNDLKLMQKLYPEVYPMGLIMLTEEEALNMCRMLLIIHYAEFIGRTDTGDLGEMENWNGFREKFGSEEFGITHALSNLGLFNLIRDRLNEECKK